MLKVTVVLVLLCFLPIAEGMGCPDDWTGHGSSCYLFIATKQAWVQAGQVCAGHGAALAAIESAEENLFIMGYLKVFNDIGADMGTWVGGSDMDIEGIWKWFPSGERANYTDWPTGQPNGSGDCLLLYSGSGFHWEDAACDQKWHLMCEIPKEADPVIG